MDDDEKQASARQWLRNEQKIAASNSALKYNDEEAGCTQAVLDYLDTYYATEPTSDPERVTRGPFSYRASNEKQRMARAIEITKRVKPGSFEDPNYFAMLCFQFATAQLAFAGTAEGPFNAKAMNETASRALFGTVARPQINAFANKESLAGYHVIGLNSGIVDFVYQAAKAVAAAINPHRSENGRSAISALGDINSVREKLNPDSVSVERLYKTLESYFYHGYPRASGYEAIPSEYGTVLATIVPMAERWIISHEFAHAIAAIKKFDFFTAPENPFHAEEFYADSIGTILTVQSAANFDGLPPDFSLAGGDFALACLEIKNRATGIAKTGEESSNLGGIHHPSPQERSTNNLATFRQYFNLYEGEQGTFSLELELRDKVPDNHPFDSVHSYRVTYLGQVLFAIWPFVRDRLKAQYEAGRSSHPVWTD